MTAAASNRRRARLGALVLALVALVAVFADVIASDGPLLLVHRGSVTILPAITHAERFGGKRADEIAAMLAPDDRAVWPLVRSGPTTISTTPPLARHAPGHPLGTDAFGRDVLARLVHGARTALGLGLVAAALALAVGVLLGGTAGALGGFWDGLVERFAEGVVVFPAVILAALLRAIEQKPSLASLLVVVALVRATEMARLVRALVVRAWAEEWALAARALGAPPTRVVFRHILPNVLGAIVVSTVFSVGAIVLLETALSFLGLGVPTDFASWGEMLGEIRWGASAGLVLLPAIALATTAGALFLVGDALRDAIDPRAESEDPLA